MNVRCTDENSNFGFQQFRSFDFFYNQLFTSLVVCLDYINNLTKSKLGKGLNQAFKIVIEKYASQMTFVVFKIKDSSITKV